MSKIKVLHTADVHIGAELSYLGEHCQRRKFEVLETFKGIAELCQKEKVEICLIAGDLFDSNPAGQSFAPAVFDAISKSPKTRFFYVAGNHDPLDASSPFEKAKLPENLTVFGNEYGTVEIPELKVRVCGKSFAHSAMSAEEMPSMADDGFVNILLLHADFGAQSNYNPISSQFVEASGADYVALGHIHKRTAIEKIGKSYISYPGCPEGQGFDENGSKGVYMGCIDKGSCEMTFVKTAKRLHATDKIDLSSAENTDDAKNIIIAFLKEKYGESFKDNLYKLVLTGAVAYPSAIKTEQLALMLEGEVYFAKIKNCIQAKIDLEALSNELSLKGIFAKKMLEKISVAADGEKEKMEKALYLGLKAFDSEVAYDED